MDITRTIYHSIVKEGSKAEVVRTLSPRMYLVENNPGKNGRTTSESSGQIEASMLPVTASSLIIKRKSDGLEHELTLHDGDSVLIECEKLDLFAINGGEVNCRVSLLVDLVGRIRE